MGMLLAVASGSGSSDAIRLRRVPRCRAGLSRALATATATDSMIEPKLRGRQQAPGQLAEGGEPLLGLLAGRRRVWPGSRRPRCAPRPWGGGRGGSGTAPRRRPRGRSGRCRRPISQPGAGLSQLRIGSPLVRKRAWSTVEVASALSWGWPATPPKWLTKVPTLGASRSYTCSSTIAARRARRLGVRAEDRLHPRVGAVELPLDLGLGGGEVADGLHHAPGQLLGRGRPHGRHGEVPRLGQLGAGVGRGLAAPLVGPRQGQLAEERLDVVLHRHELRRQQVEQLGVRRRVVVVVQVDRVDDPPPHHQGPEPVDDVAGECGRLGRGQARAQQGPAADDGYGADLAVLVGGDQVFLPLGDRAARPRACPRAPAARSCGSPSS